MFLLILGREEGRKREREMPISYLLHSPTRDKPKPWACELTGNGTGDLFLKHWTMVNQLSHDSQGKEFLICPYTKTDKIVQIVNGIIMYAFRQSNQKIISIK